MSNMKTFQTKRAEERFKKWYATLEGEDGRRTADLLERFVPFRDYIGIECDYHGLRDLIREFCEGMGLEVTKIYGKWSVQDIHSRELVTKPWATYDLALLAALEKALEVK